MIGDLVAGSVATAAQAADSITLSPPYTPTLGNTRFATVRAHSSVPTDIHSPDGLWTLWGHGVQVVPNLGDTSSAIGIVAVYYRAVQLAESAVVRYSSIGVGTEMSVFEVEGSFADVATDADTVSQAITEGVAPWDHFAPMGSLDITAPALVIGIAAWSSPPSTLHTYSVDRGAVVESGFAGANAPCGMTTLEYVTSSETVAPIADYNAISATNGHIGSIMSFAGPVVLPDPGPVVVVFDPDDVELADLTDDVYDVKVRIELNATGWGSFKVNRNAALATADVLKPGNYVRVTIPQIDPDPICGFFLEGPGAPESPTIRLVSHDEEGGEEATAGGRGSLSYWDRAIWLAQSFLVDWVPAYIRAEHGAPPAGTLGAIGFAPGTYKRYTTSGSTITGDITFTTAGGFSSYYDRRKRYTRTIGGIVYRTTLVHLTTGGVNGWYVKPWGKGVTEYKAAAHYRFGNSILMESIDDGDKPGQVIYAMYQEAIAADRPIHPLPGMTVDFDATTDSNGDPWATTDALKAVSAEIGDDYLSTIGKLANTGAVDVYMDPDLGMHAYNSYGRDLTGAVRFAKGLNIADDLERDFSDQPTGTFVEVQGASDGVIARVIVAGAPPREISLRGDSDDTDVLEALGTAELALRALHSDSVGFGVDTPIVGREDPDNGLYLPGPPGSAHGDYWIGDLVTVHTGSDDHDFDEEEVRIAAITLTFTEANDLRSTVEVISGFGGIPTLGSPTSGGPTAVGPGSPSTISDQYQLLAERDQPYGYPSLDDDALLDPLEVPVVEDLRTDETDTTLRLAPDGTGGLEFAASSTVAALDDLTDVAITAPADGQMLRRVAGVWVNVPLLQPVVEDDGAGSYALVFDVDGEVIWDA